MSDLRGTENVADYFGSRARWAVIFVMVVLALLSVKLLYLQLIRGASYVEQSRSNRTRLVRLPPARGMILDSEGRLLAGNKPRFTFSVVRGELEDLPKVLDTCSPVLGMNPEKLRSIIRRSHSIPRFRTYPIKKNLTLEEVSLIKSRVRNLSGVVVEVKPQRVYPFGQSLCHVLGTLGEISADELSRRAEKGYRPGDVVGKSGIEKKYESYLKGVEGWEQIEINAQGLQLGSQAIRAPVSGADTVLTVDASLQRFVEETFVDRAGSVVVVDPDTGRILAMVSEPGFDLNLFSPSITKRQWQDLGGDPLHPLENRSIRGLYSPASTFKIVTASAALAENLITPKTTFTCKGELELAGQRFRCWKPNGHGKISLHRAIVESCDIYFYHLGLKLGGSRIARYASLFGLGKPTGLELPGELPGLIPTSAWKLRTYGESWKDGETLNLAIGQGYLVSTPIQLAMMAATMANGGNLLQPAIVRQIRAADGRILFDHVPVVRWKVPLKEDDRSLLEDAMIGVVFEENGTGKNCRIPGIRVAGKTGTSQVIRHRHRPEENVEVPYHERSHAIFVGYVNDMPRKIAVVVVVEHGGGGGKSAAPIARKIICRYYGVPDPGETRE